MRYNELHRSSGREDGGRIWIKTFDAHLKLLVALKIVEKHEESRYKVFYKLAVSGTVPAEEAKERHKVLSFYTEMSTDTVSKLYSNREKLTEKLKKDALDVNLFVLIDNMEISLFSAISIYRENPAYSNFIIDEAVEFFRKSSREISSVVGQSKETQSFFLPFLLRIQKSRRKRAESVRRRFMARAL